jgi:rhodanese-related sulfurtransferase
MDTIPVGRAVRFINARRRAFLLAVMDAEEFAADHIPGSLRCDVAENEQVDRVLRELRARPLRRVILYSATSGPEAYQAAEWLEELGVGPVHILEGGMEAWDSSGYALASDLQRDQLAMTQHEHDRRLIAAGTPFVDPRR